MRALYIVVLVLFVGSSLSQAQTTIYPAWSTPVVGNGVFSPDGSKICTWIPRHKFLVSGSSSVSIWNATSGELITTITDNSDTSSVFSSVSFNSTGDKIIATRFYRPAQIYDATSGVLLHTLYGSSNKHWATFAAYNSKGDRVVTVADIDSSAVLWNANTGAVISSVKEKTYIIKNAVFNNAGDRFVTQYSSTQSRDFMKIWNAENGALVSTSSPQDHGQTISIAFNKSDDKIIISEQTFDGGVSIFDASNASRLKKFSVKGPVWGNVSSAYFNSASDKFVTTHSPDSVARVWNASTGELLHTYSGHKGKVGTAVFNNTGNAILTTSDDGTAKLWNAQTGTELYTFDNKYSKTLSSVVFTTSGDKVLTNYNGVSKIWSTANGTLLFDINGHTAQVNKVFINSTNTKVITLSSDTTRINTKVWDAGTGKYAYSLVGHSFPIRSVAFNGAGDKIISSCNDSTAKIWDVNTGTVIKTLAGHTSFVYSALFNNTNDKIITAGGDNTAKIWDANTGAIIKTLVGHSRAVIYAAFNNTGDKVLTIGADTTVKVWNANTGDVIATFKGHKDRINTAEFNSTSDKIVTASEDNTAKIWSITTGTMVANLNTHTNFVKSAQFSNDGSKVVTASWDDSVKVWNVSTGATIASLYNQYGYFQSAMFDNTGNNILVAGRTGVFIWDANTGSLRTLLKGQSLGANYASYNSNYDKIVAAGYDGTARLWNRSNTSSSAEDKTKEQSALDVYPNPTNGIVHINIPEHRTDINAETTVEVYSVLGHLVFRQPVQYPITTINLTSLTHGAYQVRWGSYHCTVIR